MAEKSTNGAAVRGKKGDGPLVITYLDAEGNEAKRVTETTETVRVADRNGNKVEYRVDALQPVTRNQLAAIAVAKRIDTYVRNQADEKGSNVIELANSVFDGLKSNIIYSRKEGAGSGKKGRPFDAKFWVGIMAETVKMKKKEATPAQLAAFEQKLIAMPPKDRKEFLDKYKNGDKVFAVAWKKAEAAKLAASIKSGSMGDEDALSELF